MQVSTRARASLIFHARQSAECARWRAVHLRGVHTFRSIETEFANLFFSFRDSDSPSPPKSKRGGSSRFPVAVLCSVISSLLSALLSSLSFPLGDWDRP